MNGGSGWSRTIDPRLIKTVVKTQNGEQTSGFSNVKSAKAVPAKTTLKAKASDAKNVKLTWSKVKGASG